MKSRLFHVVYKAFSSDASSLNAHVSLLSLYIHPELPLVLWTCLWPFSACSPLPTFTWLTLISPSGLGTDVTSSRNPSPIFCRGRGSLLLCTQSSLYFHFVNGGRLPPPGYSLHQESDDFSLASSRASPGYCLRRIYWVNAWLIS